MEIYYSCNICPADIFVTPCMFLTNGMIWHCINWQHWLIICLYLYCITDKVRVLTDQVFPTANSAVLDQLNTVDCIIYAMGSLFTSICPSLVSPYQFRSKIHFSMFMSILMFHAMAILLFFYDNIDHLFL